MKNKHNEIVNDCPINFKQCEQIAKKIAFSIAQDLLIEFLNILDTQLVSEVDFEKYEHHGFKKTSLQTTVGFIPIKRREYKVRGQKEYMFMLDQKLGSNIIGRKSELLMERIIDLTTTVSFRDASDILYNETGERISHGSLHNLTQKYAEKVKKDIAKDVKKLEDGWELNTEKKKVDTLFVEADGIYVNLQGKDRKKSKNKEIKVATFYEGWESRYEKPKSDNKAYVRVNKKVVAGIYEDSKIDKHLEVKLRNTYDIDSIENIIVNGDGATWIRNVLGDRNYHFQLDVFHVHQCILRNVKDKKVAKRISGLIRDKKINQAIAKIEQEKFDCGGVEKEVKKLETLRKYLENNKDGLIAYKERKNINIKEPKEGIVYRNLGTMEHTVCDTIKARMKKNKTCWSIDGADKMALLRAMKNSNELFKTVNTSSLSDKQERYKKIEGFIRIDESYKRYIKKSARSIACSTAPIPYEGAAITAGRKVIQDLCKGGYRI
jgi:hypothetical protein